MGLNLVILAAGRGSRLGPRTAKLPKCLNLYRGRAILEHLLDNSKNLSKSMRIYLVGGYRSNLLEEFGYPVIKNQNWNKGGPFESMIAADEILSSDESVVCYSDIVFSRDYFEACIDSSAEIFLPSNKRFVQSWKGRRINYLDDLETFKLSGNLLSEIGGKPSTIDEIEGQFAGLLKLTPNGWKKLRTIGINSQNPKLDVTALLSLAIKAKLEIETTQVDGFWKEFDEPSDFEN